MTEKVILVRIGYGLRIAGSMPAATVGEAYEVTLTAVGGQSPYSFELSSENVVDAVGFVDNGDGTATFSIANPQQAGVYEVVVRLRDATRRRVFRTFSLQVIELPLDVSGELAAATVNSAYSDTLTVSGARGTYSLIGATLPTGMSASLSGSTITVSGTPTTGHGVAAGETGTFTVSLTVSDVGGAEYVYTQALSLTVPDFVVSPQTFPYDDLIALLHFDGVDGSTTITDEVNGNTWTVTGTPQISSSDVKFGTGTALFDAGGYIECASDDSFLIDGPFTIAFQVSGAINTACPFSNSARTYLYNDSFYVNGTLIANALIMPTDKPAFTHIEITRDASNDIRVFVDGVQTGSTGNYVGAADFRSMNIGRYQATDNLEFTGRIDELLLLGSALHTTDFTPPTSAYPAHPLTDGEAGVYYEDTFNVTGGVGGYTIVSFDGPSGLSASIAGSTVTISGVTDSGSYTLTVVVADSDGNQATGVASLTVAAAGWDAENTSTALTTSNYGWTASVIEASQYKAITALSGIATGESREWWIRADAGTLMNIIFGVADDNIGSLVSDNGDSTIAILGANSSSTVDMVASIGVNNNLSQFTAGFSSSLGSGGWNVFGASLGLGDVVKLTFDEATREFTVVQDGVEVFSAVPFHATDDVAPFRPAISIAHAGTAVTLSYGIAIAGVPLAIGTAGQAYSTELTVVGGDGTYTVSRLSGLPSGLSYSFASDTLTISGTLAADADESSPYSIEVMMTDGAGASAITTTNLEVVAVDPYFANVVSLLHFEDAHGSTTVTDEIGNTWTGTGSPAISKHWQKFGKRCLDFSSGTVTKYIRSTDAAVRYIAGDFTLDGWVMWDSTTTQSTVCYDMGYATTDVANSPFFVRTSASHQVELWVGGSVRFTSSLTVTTGTWYHVVVERVDSVWTVYVEGVVYGTYDSGTVQTIDADYFGLGSSGSASTYTRVDEVRLTVGVARYNGAFTPPTQSFPDA